MGGAGSFLITKLLRFVEKIFLGEFYVESKFEKICVICFLV